MTILKLKPNTKLVLNALLIVMLVSISWTANGNYIDVGHQKDYQVQALFRAKSLLFVSAGKDSFGIGVGFRTHNFNTVFIHNHKTDNTLLTYYRTNKSEYEYQLTFKQKLNESKVYPSIGIVYYVYNDFGIKLELANEVFVGFRRKF